MDEILKKLGRIEAMVGGLIAAPVDRPPPARDVAPPPKTYRVEVKNRDGEMWPVLTGMGPTAAQSAVLQLWAAGSVARMVGEE